MDREEIKKIVEQEAKKKTSNEIIAQKIGKSLRTVNDIKKELKAEGRLLGKRQVEDIIAREVKNGTRYEKIAEMTNRSLRNVYKIKEQLRAKGKLTDQDIEEGDKKREIEFLTTDPKMLKIKLGLEQGKTHEMIAEEVNLSRQSIGIYAKKYRQYGLLTHGEMEYLTTDSVMIEIRNYIKKGYLYSQISEIMPYSEDELSKYANKFVKYGLLTKDNIEIAEMHRERELMQVNPQVMKILEGINKGKSATTITSEVIYSRTLVMGYINKLMKYGMVTPEDIENAKKIKQVEEFKKNSITKVIMIYLDEGYAYIEIAEKIGCHRDTVSEYVSKLIEYGLTTREEIESARRRRQEIDNEIVDLLGEGLVYEEISEALNCTIEHIMRLEKKYINWGKFTLEGLQKARQLRPIKEVERLLSEGYIYKEIKAITGKEVSEIKQIESDAILSGKFTKEDLEIARIAKKKEIKQEIEKYNTNIKKAKKIIDDEEQFSDSEIRECTETFIYCLRKKADEGNVTEEELKIMDQLILMGIPNADNIASAARIHLKLGNFQRTIRVVNYSKEFVEGEDKKKLEAIVTMAKLTIKQHQAERLLSDGISAKEVSERTGLNEIDVLELKRNIGTDGFDEPRDR